MEAPVRIENRAQLIYLLTEAAELEHGIMCCYLFSAFSMKRDVKEGITKEQLPFLRRWRGTILQVGDSGNGAYVPGMQPSHGGGARSSFTPAKPSFEA